MRFFAALILILSIFLFPFWATILLAFLGMIYFKMFYEAPIIFLISDLFYGVQETRYYNYLLLSSTIALMTLFIIELLKKKLKFYNSLNDR